MELKVWVEGIQRVVCGVTDVSTCQDVVYALAHATGQTGRFTLVEKWRNSERLLAPHEQPLKVLTKWGEYANDVHFVMRKSAQGDKNHLTVHQNNKRQHEFLRTSNGKQLKTPPLSSKEIKKSLTFSCGHGSSGSSVSSTENHSPNDSGHVQQDPSITKNLKNRAKQDLPKGVVRGVPQKPPRNSESPIAKIERPKYPPSYDEAVSRSSGRFSTSHLSIANNNTSQPDEESPSNKRLHLSSSNRDRGDHQFSSPGSSTSSSSRLTSSSSRSHIILEQQPSPNSHILLEQHQASSNSHILLEQHQASSNSSRSHIILEQPPSSNRDLKSPDATTRLMSPDRAKSSAVAADKPSINTSGLPDDSSSLKLKKSMSSKLDADKHIVIESKSLSRSKSPSPEDLSSDPQYQDLLRLVSLQREKMDNQQTELSQFDAEIVYWEGRLQEQEQKLSLLQEEVCHLERTHHEQEGELIQLDRRSFSEEVELGRQEERTLRSELTLARSQLANCETELLQCRQRMRLLLEELAEERRKQDERHQEQVEQMHRQIKEMVAEADSQKSSSEQAKDELHELEVKVSDKQQELEKLLSEIKEANLHSLSLLPSDEGKILLEGNFCNRPGSTRKIIGSPRQLENAVPTSKNPHGVWV